MNRYVSKVWDILAGVLILMLFSVSCSGGRDPSAPSDKELNVSEISYSDTVSEYVPMTLSVDASGDEEIEYFWTVNPENAGIFSNPSSQHTTFKPAGVHEDKEIEIAVSVDSANFDPVVKTAKVNIINKITTAPNLWEMDYLSLHLAEIDGHRYIYNYTGTHPDFQVGDLITSTVGKGYLRKIMAIHDTGTQIILGTLQARIVDAILDGYIESVVDFSASKSVSYARYGAEDTYGLYQFDYEPAIEFNPAELDLFFEGTGKILSDDKIQLKFGEGSVIRYMPKIKVVMDFVGESPMIKFGDYRGEFAADLYLEGSGSDKNYYTQQNIEVQVPLSLITGLPDEIAVEMGPVNVYLSLKLSMGYQLTMGGEGYLNAGAEVSYSGYELGGTLYPPEEGSVFPEFVNGFSPGYFYHNVHAPDGNMNKDADIKFIVSPVPVLRVPEVADIEVRYYPHIRIVSDYEVLSEPDNWCVQHSMYGGQMAYYDWKYLNAKANHTMIEPMEAAMCDPQPCSETGPCLWALEIPVAKAKVNSIPPLKLYKEIQFDASESKGQIVEYAWDWENDGIFNTFSMTPFASHSYSIIKMYSTTHYSIVNVQLRVKDVMNRVDTLDEPLELLIYY